MSDIANIKTDVDAHLWTQQSTKTDWELVTDIYAFEGFLGETIGFLFFGTV
jgi:hypothetical protein